MKHVALSFAQIDQAFFSNEFAHWFWISHGFVKLILDSNMHKLGGNPLANSFSFS